MTTQDDCPECGGPMTVRTRPAHSCPLPKVKHRDLHRLWICDCGRAYRAVCKSNYADAWNEWIEWTP